MVVKPGQRLIVRDQAGKNQGGRLVSITGDRLELEILRPFRFRTSTLSLTEDTVLRIDEQDSLKNGVLIGVGIGAALAAVGTATCHQESCSGAAALGLMLGPEVYRVSRRPHFLGGWGLWDVRVGIRRRCGSARSGW